jgi:hypothetical protein
MRYFKHIILLLLFPVLLLSQNDWTNPFPFSPEQTPILAIGDTNVLASKILSKSYDNIVWNEVAKVVFDYNKFGLLVTQTHFCDTTTYRSPTLAGGDFLESDDTLYYDQYNRLIEKHIYSNHYSLYIKKTEYFSDNKIKKILVSQKNKDRSYLDFFELSNYFYDNDSLSYVYFYSSDSMNAEPKYRDYYTYNGKIQKDIYRQYKVNGVWKDSTQQTFKYSPTGKLIYNLSTYQYVERMYEYDPVTDLVLKEKVYYVKVLRGLREYKYNNKGQVIYIEETSPFDYYIEEYFYDNDKLSSIQHRTKNYLYLDVWVWDYIDTKFIYLNGQLIQKIFTYSLNKDPYNTPGFGKIDYQYRMINGVDDEKTENTLISVSPNPATDFIEIDLTRWAPLDKWSPSVEIKIFNVFGQTVSTPVCSEATPASGGQRIDVSGLVSGMYFVRIGDKVMKFVKL